MKRLLCRNTLKDYDTWRPLFDGNLDAAREAGLELEHLWRCADDPNEVFFMFTVKDVDAANAFMADPASAEIGRTSGVVDGACWFLE